MEHFIARTQYLHEHQRIDAPPFGYVEVLLTMPVGDFLIQCWDWSDLRSNLTQSLAAYHSPVTSAGSVSVCVCWRKLTGSSNHNVKLTIVNDPRQPLPLGRPTLQVLEFAFLHFKEDHYRALATIQRTDVEVKFRHCQFDPQDAEGIFIEWFRNNQVVTELVDCQIDIKMLSALSGNDSVKRLSISYDCKYENDQIRFLAQALPGNMGIEHLTLKNFRFTAALWKLLFRSLSTHPRLKCLSIDHSRHGCMTMSRCLSFQRRATRMYAILSMLQRNTVVCTIDFPGGLNSDEIYRNSILPRLEMNRTCFEVQRQAVKRADPSIRPQLLGRALHVVQNNPNLVFLFLSENVSAFVRSGDAGAVAPFENDPSIVRSG